MPDPPQMPVRDRRRTVNGVLIMATLAAERGLPLESFLAGTGLLVPTLDEPALALSFEQEFQCIRNLLQHCGTAAGLGFEIGRRYRFTSLASVGFAQVSSPTLRRAIEVTLRYAELNVTMVRLTIDDSGEGLRLRYIDAELPQDLRPFAIERSMAVALTIASDLMGRAVIPLAVEFNFPEPANASTYFELAGVQPSFDCPESALMLSTLDVDAPLSNSNPLALLFAEDQCRQWAARWQQRIGFSARVCELIAGDPGNLPDLDAVASALHISARTLRRKLLLENTSYLKLCDEVRQAVAEQLLAVPRLPIEQIAERLGYSESASFIHAFKRWRGTTPQAYRLAQSAAPQSGQ